MKLEDPDRRNAADCHHWNIDTEKLFMILYAERVMRLLSHGLRVRGVDRTHYDDTYLADPSMSLQLPRFCLYLHRNSRDYLQYIVLHVNVENILDRIRRPLLLSTHVTAVVRTRTLNIQPSR